MADGLIPFLLQSIVISMSGVLAPGPVTAAALAAGARRRHAGALIAAGHGVVEFPLVLLIMAGVGSVLASRGFRIGIGLVGGAFLVTMGIQMLRSASAPAAVADTGKRRYPLLTGIVLTAGNPYFLVWWATVGLTLTAQAMEIGILAFGLFALVHWLCDLTWLEVLSLASHKGSRVLGGRVQRIVLGVCAVALLGFGVMFIAGAVRTWARPGWRVS
jgi:threonine/homoserine/homoserine lactone efflux protein